MGFPGGANSRKITDPFVMGKIPVLGGSIQDMSWLKRLVIVETSEDFIL